MFQMWQGICLQILNYFIGKNVLISSIISNYEVSFPLFLFYAVLLQVLPYCHFMLIATFFNNYVVFLYCLGNAIRRKQPWLHIQKVAWVIVSWRRKNCFVFLVITCYESWGLEKHFLPDVFVVVYKLAMLKKKLSLFPTLKLKYFSFLLSTMRERITLSHFILLIMHCLLIF